LTRQSNVRRSSSGTKPLASRLGWLYTSLDPVPGAAIILGSSSPSLKAAEIPNPSMVVAANVERSQLDQPEELAMGPSGKRDDQKLRLFIVVLLLLLTVTLPSVKGIL
jgi:hypothetical protein